MISSGRSHASSVRVETYSRRAVVASGVFLCNLFTCRTRAIKKQLVKAGSIIYSSNSQLGAHWFRRGCGNQSCRSRRRWPRKKRHKSNCQQRLRLRLRCLKTARHLTTSDGPTPDTSGWRHRIRLVELGACREFPRDLYRRDCCSVPGQGRAGW